MNGIYTQPKSPYYWLRYYDKFEPEPSRKRKSVNTKIQITPADKRRLESARQNGQKVDLQGTPELKKLLKEFKSGLAERDIQLKSGVKLRKDLKLSEGYAEFKKARTVPGSKKELKKKTLINYDIAVAHMIQACGDKKIYKYTDKKDYVDLLHYFENLKIKGKKIIKKDKTVDYEYRNMSTNSRSIYTRALQSLWNYFVEEKHASKNIIEPVDSEETDPNPIPPDEMYSIVSYLREVKEYPHQYWIVYFMLLTGCRPSSAIVQLKEDIDFKGKKITIRNVKAGKRKKKLFYRFPLYKELEKLIREMGVKEGDKGRLFDMYQVVPENYTWPLSFWDRRIKLLKTAKSISDMYTLKQIRPTFISFLINILKMNIYVVYKLADHANIKITDKHYVDFKLNSARRELDDISLDSFLEEEI